jgi:hypothetical protein
MGAASKARLSEPIPAQAPVIAPEQDEVSALSEIPAAFERIHELLDRIFTIAHAGQRGNSLLHLRNLHKKIEALADAAMNDLDLVKPHLQTLYVLYKQAAKDEKFPCPACEGSGLNPLNSHVHGHSSCRPCRGRGTIKLLRPLQDIANRLKPLATQIALVEQAKQAAHGLSREQRLFLKVALRAHADRGLGFSLKALRGPEAKTSASNAGFSRMLGRLEKRGLLVRTNWQTGISDQGIIRTLIHQPKVARTSHILLTPLGKAVAAIC